MVNIIIDAYLKENPDTKLELVKLKIKVRTQFKHFMNDANTTKIQDIKITEDEDESATYVEFQIRVNPTNPIKERSVKYFALGISHSKGKYANQMWLLADDVPEVFHGKTFARYILKDEVTNKEHPEISGILYINLKKLSQQKSPAGELASFLLGNEIEIQNEPVKKITEAFNSSFESFKSDKEAIKVWSLAERYTNNGYMDGIEIGHTKGKLEGKREVIGELLELISKGIDPVEAMRRITEELE
jgi:hypothetical protein